MNGDLFLWARSSSFFFLLSSWQDHTRQTCSLVIVSVQEWATNEWCTSDPRAGSVDEPSGRPAPLGDSATWNVVDDQTRLANCMLYVRCAAFFDTLDLEFLVLIPMGRRKDIQLKSRRREQRDMKNKKSNVANLLEAQWVHGKALPRGNRGHPWKKAANDCDYPTSAIQKGGNAVMFCERCELCGNRGDPGFGDHVRQPHNALVNRETTSRDRTPLLSTRAGEHDDARPLHSRVSTGNARWKNEKMHSERQHFVLLCGGAARWRNPSILSAIAGVTVCLYYVFVFLSSHIFQTLFSFSSSLHLLLTCAS